MSKDTVDREYFFMAISGIVHSSILLAALVVAPETAAEIAADIRTHRLPAIGAAGAVLVSVGFLTGFLKWVVETVEAMSGPDDEDLVLHDWEE